MEFATTRWSKSRSDAAGVPAQRAGAFAPHKRFAAGKTLAQGGFTPPEHVKYPGSPRDGTSRGACGITFEKFQDIKEGDIIEAYLMEQIEV